MYKNRSDCTNRYLFVGLLILIVTGWINGCAKSRSRSDSRDASNAAQAKITGQADALPDAGEADSEIDTSIVAIDAADGEDLGFDAALPPQEILDELESLLEPDFLMPLEELAAEHCGYLFTAESEISTAEDTDTVVETRAFDSTGRLIAAELRFVDDVLIDFIPAVFQNRRLQIDYDSTERPVRVRLGPMFWMRKEESIGSVVRIEYESDGSTHSRFITNETDQQGGPPTGHGYFCEQLRFDRYGSFVDRTWDCANPTTVQSRAYDEQRRVVSEREFFSSVWDEYRPIPIGWGNFVQRGEWEIDFSYDDAKHEHTIIWKEYDQKPISWRHGIYPNTKKTEHRLVRTFDEAGQRLLVVDYDFENDGESDERTVYTYQEGGLKSKEIDLWRDGVIDIVETHTRSEASHRVERRNMTSDMDKWFLSISMDEWKDSFTRTSAILPPQSQAVTEYAYDSESRPITIDLEMSWLYRYTPEGSVMGEVEATPVSESWHEIRVYADPGFVTEKRVVWEPSDELLEVQRKDTSRDQSPGNSPNLFESIASTTTCSLTPLCPDAEMVLPEDMRLVTCEVAFIFPEYQSAADIPSISRDDDTNVVPPYDALPGIQNLLKRSYEIYGFPGPPNVRDIVDY